MHPGHKPSLSASRVCFFFCFSSLPGKGPREAKVLRSTDLLRVGAQVCLAGKPDFLVISPASRGSLEGRLTIYRVSRRLIPHVQASAVQGKGPLKNSSADEHRVFRTAGRGPLPPQRPLIDPWQRDRKHCNNSLGTHYMKCFLTSQSVDGSPLCASQPG